MGRNQNAIASPEAPKYCGALSSDMEVWGWVVLYVLLFTLLQLLLYRYLRDEDRSLLQSAPGRLDASGFDDLAGDRFDEYTDDRFEGDDHDRSDGTESGLDERDDHRRCPHCGSPNDRAYTFCRNCVNPLAG